MTIQLEAVLMIAQYPSVSGILMPVIDIDCETIHWDRLSVGGLSGGQRAAVSWAFCIWTDMQIPSDKYSDELVNIKDSFWRDPFEGFGVMDQELQELCLAALAYRHGIQAFDFAVTQRRLHLKHRRCI